MKQTVIGEACVGIKRAVNKNHKRLQKKSPKPRKSVKLSSEDWYQKGGCEGEHQELMDEGVAKPRSGNRLTAFGHQSKGPTLLPGLFAWRVHLGFNFMATREQRIAEFNTGKPPIEVALEVLCEDHNGTYLLPFLCRWTNGAWVGEHGHLPLQATVLGWRAR